LAFLAQHDKVAQVVGVDGIAKALEQFAQEQPDLQIEAVETTESYQSWKGKKITLLKGDFFELTSEVTGGKFTAIYDRASLVAIEPDMRAKYVEIMGQVLAPGGKILLIVVEHDNKTGPPYSFQPADVEALYGSLGWVESVTLLNSDGPGKDETGNSGMGSRWYMIQAK
jgi:thiopurine S-methyltransferase